jgi:biotin carboxylase
MTTDQHRLVILGSMDEFIDLVKRARARGIYTIVCDGYGDGPAKAYADKTYLEDVRHTDEIAAICRAEKADGIIASFSDLLAECMIDIADAAGLPAYLKPSGERYLREKPLMKQMFAELGIASPRYEKIRLDSLEEDFAAMSFPCVIKPVNGYGSHGVFVANSLDDVRERFAAATSQSSFDYLMAEEYNDGPEFNIITWIVEGQAHIISIADREKMPFEEGEIPQVVRCAYPSPLTARLRDEAAAIATKIAGYVGLENGPLCIQAFYNEGEGLSVCEAAGRIFGYEHELVTLGSGLSMEELLLDLVYDPEAAKARVRAHSPLFDTHAAGLYFHGHDGDVADTSAVDALGELPGVVEYLPFYRPGDVISHERGAKPYVVRYYLTGGSREAVDALTDKIFAEASVLDPQGRELLLRRQDADR